jgi:uncharacterized membrane protein
MERRHEITRLEAFSDAVFAFALTLLVVSLEIPKNTGELFQLVRGFLPFGLTFAMICWLWYEHQQFFSRYSLQDPWTVTLNSLLLFVVLFYVYPLKFVTLRLLGPTLGLIDPETHVVFEGGMHDGDKVMLLYSTGVVLIFGVFVALYYHAWRIRQTLALTEEETLDLRNGIRSHVISGSLGIVSILIVLGARKSDNQLLMTASGLVYMLMWPLHTLNGFRHGKAIAALRKKESADAKR